MSENEPRIETIPAKERAPFFVLTALYLIVLATGFGIEAPLLAPNSLFIVALVLIVLGHLTNVYRIGVLLQRYPRPLLLTDFALVGILALMFSLLVKPVAGGVGSTAFSVLGGEELEQYLTQIVIGDLTIEAAQNLVRKSFHRFFVLGGPLLGLLVLWHGMAEFGRYGVTLGRFRFFYTSGWLIFLILIIWGGVITSQEDLQASEWEAMINILRTLGFVAAGGAALVVIAAMILRIEYERSKVVPITTPSRGSVEKPRPKPRI